MTCALAIVRPDAAAPRFVPGFDASPCKRMTWVAEGDFNADGILDFLYTMSVPHNRYPVDADVYTFYLSQPANNSYCSVERLENALVTFPVRSSTLKLDIAQYVAKHGTGVLDCAPER